MNNGIPKIPFKFDEIEMMINPFHNFKLNSLYQKTLASTITVALLYESIKFAKLKHRTYFGETFY